MASPSGGGFSGSLTSGNSAVATGLVKTIAGGPPDAATGGAGGKPFATCEGWDGMEPATLIIRV